MNVLGFARLLIFKRQHHATIQILCDILAQQKPTLIIRNGKMRKNDLYIFIKSLTINTQTIEIFGIVILPAKLLIGQYTFRRNQQCIIYSQIAVINRTNSAVRCIVSFINPI